MDAQFGAKAIASLNWSLPLNENETAIDYYEITLIGTHTNSTMSTRKTDQSLQTMSFKYVLSEGNYTAASITAVDLCEQKSDLSLVELMNVTIVQVNFSDMAISDTRQNSCVAAVGGISGIAAITIIAALSLGVILVIKLRLCCCSKKIIASGNGIKMVQL